MIITLKLTATDDAPLAPFGPATHIIHSRARYHHWEGVGALSIKSFFNGQAYYESGEGRFVVDDGSYLLLNQMQPYSITVDSATPVESFCLFFEPGFAEETYRALATRDEQRLLDEPTPPSLSPINLFDRTYAHDDLLSPALLGLRATLPRRVDDRLWLAEQLHTVMQRLLHAHRAVYKEVEALPAARASTREELYRRLHRARDYVSASYNQPLTLEEMARVACLSPNHFLRTWKGLFHQTPHQYLTARRIERAQHLLLRSDDSVTEICLAVGFESLGSFSWLFRRHTGLSPEAYRREKGDFKEAPTATVPYNYHSGAYRL
jgi:AraC family transcriptional regulator